MICRSCGAPLQKDRRFFYLARIENRGKSLPFTTREPDFVPDENTVRRKTDRFDELLTKLYARRIFSRRGLEER